ncbi:NADH:flavin oxidoreductase/NADH oxidase [Taibaiella helva]|uniref:NADH:flavin oxidoreductase/NADH oxidase n=1 Tax=Taibaiella helva TaxID=2301235 RepID=UPI000E56E1D6|nr:NADH:flavin oxidoreductase/NADH oxidase [Taibaiella helva]
MSLLFSPLPVKGLVLKNRIVVSPMCQYSAEDGFANDWHLVHLGSRAVGGAALIIAEATAVSPEGRISPDDQGIWKDEHISMLKRITDFIHRQHAYAGIQLAHAGRKASTLSPWKGNARIRRAEGGWQTVAPSPVPFREADEAPEMLDKAGIRKVVADFAAAAGRAVSAGYDVIELHAAHGYLLHQFLSPLSNQRTDEYGGSFENRIRLLLEVVAAVQSEMAAHMPLFVRISATDWVDGGWDIDQSVQLVALLADKGVDLVDVSTGGLVTGVRIPLEPGYQVPFAERIRKETGILTGAVGLISSAQQAEQILEEEQADLILMARELLRNPYFPLHAAVQLEDEPAYLPQYERAKPGRGK